MSWVCSQHDFATIFLSVAPLREEMESLGAEMNGLQSNHDELQETIKNIEDSLTKYKEEYKSLIAESERIKSDMESVQNKVYPALCRSFHARGIVTTNDHL